MASDSPITFTKNSSAVKSFDKLATQIGFDYLSEDNPYTTYSGADIVATITVPGGETFTLGELQTLSYSIHRENTPVRLIGHDGPVAFVRGSRTIAGSMIFTVFRTYAFYKLSCLKSRAKNGSYPIADQIPPFDITITFANEYGSFSRMKILGVTIVDEGGSMSVDDLMIEQTYTYMARSIQPITGYIPHDTTAADNGPVTQDLQSGNKTVIIP